MLIVKADTANIIPSLNTSVTNMFDNKMCKHSGTRLSKSFHNINYPGKYGTAAVGHYHLIYQGAMRGGEKGDGENGSLLLVLSDPFQWISLDAFTTWQGLICQ